MGRVAIDPPRVFSSARAAVVLIDELRDAWRAESRAHRVALAGIVMIAAALRLAHLDQPMRYDESVTFLYFATLPWEQALSTYTYPNNHLFHTALVKGAAMIFGGQPWALRLPAFLAGVVIVPATYAVARAMYGGAAALLAAAIVGSSGALTLYATNARGYSLVVLAFLLLMLIAIRIQRGAPGGDWVAFGCIAALGLWTIPVMLFPLGAVSLWLALWASLSGRTAELRNLGTALLIACALALLAYAPVISNEGLAAVVRNRFVAPQSWVAFFDQLPVTLRDALRSWGLGFPLPVSVVLLGGAFATLAQHRKATLLPVNFWVAAFAWCAWVLVVTHRAPFPRVWLWILPVAAGLAGAGMLILARRWRRTAVLVERAPMLAGIIAIGLAITVVQSRAVRTSRDTGTFNDAELAARTLRGGVAPGDRILAAIPTNAPLAYYLDLWGVNPAALTLPEESARRIFAVVDFEEGQTLASVTATSLARDARIFVADSAPVRMPTSAIVTFRRRDAAQK
jgi:4-amino-4-deoxy-L-arabinose transferase-like glycosyltransferase